MDSLDFPANSLFFIILEIRLPIFLSILRVLGLNVKSSKIVVEINESISKELNFFFMLIILY